MWDVKSEAFADRVKELVEECPYISKDPKDGSYYIEIDAAYNDEISDETLDEIVSAKDPEQKFWDMLYEGYADCEWEYRHAASAWIVDRLNEEQEGEDDEPVEPCDVDDILIDLVSTKFPADYFLNESVFVDIIVDAGDANYDFTLNQPVRSWDGQEQDTFSDESGLLWLVRQQGYTKTQIKKALHSEEWPEDRFLRSVVWEISNVTTHMNGLTFFVDMTLREWLDLWKAQQQEAAGNVDYYPWKSKGRGYIVLGKNTTCGLFDPWNGAGAMCEIKLAKDVRLPLRYIWKALPDYSMKRYGYSACSVYGLRREWWDSTLKEIHAMRKKLEKKENDVRKS